MNRLNKTEKREDIDYRKEREDRDARERQISVNCLIIDNFSDKCDFFLSVFLYLQTY